MIDPMDDEFLVGAGTCASAVLLCSHVYGLYIMSFSHDAKHVSSRTKDGGQGFTNLLFVALHATMHMGPRAAMALWALSAAVSWMFEHLGVATGKIYGSYHYPRDKPPWNTMPFLGHVPIGIPLTWITLFYPTFATVNAMVGIGTSSDGSANMLVSVLPVLPLFRALFLALVDSFVLTMLDLALDPIFSHASVGFWCWHDAEAMSKKQAGRDATAGTRFEWFGVPFRNYFGWLMTGIVVFGCFRVGVGGDVGAASAAQNASAAGRWFSVQPVLFYLTEALFYAVNPRMPDARALPAQLQPVRLVALFTSVFVGVFALGQILTL